jgi:hypothetical protein
MFPTVRVLTCYLQIDKKIIDILKRDTTWEFMTNFVRAVFPMLLVLRLADKKDPVMDKLFFYVRRMDQTLEKSITILDDWEKRTRGMSMRVLHDLCVIEHDAEIDPEFVEVDDDAEDTTDSESVYSDATKSLGQKVKELWFKRREKLITDFAIAGWLLSPIHQIYDDSTRHMSGDHRDAVDRLLKKLMGSDFADDSDELADVMNTFWEEFEQFKNKSGPFQKAYIWSEQNRDLLLGKSHLWHKKNSYFQTKILGKFACRICSKIVGMGSAERNWGDVKYLKSEKRSHLSPESVEKQATIFGASCMEDAAIEREKAESTTTDHYKFWDEDDFDQQFDMLSSTPNVSQQKLILKCYFEAWEAEHVLQKNDVSKSRFLQKYGGLEFNDIDSGVHYTISDKELQFRRRLKTDRGGWTVVAYTDNNEQDTWRIEDGCPLHDCLATYYHKHPDKNVKVILRKDQMEDFEWLVAQPPKESADALATDASESGSTVTAPSKSTRDKKPRARARARSLTSTDSRKVSVSQEKIDYPMQPCGGCGRAVGPVHKCDKCHQNMHPFCGRTIGEEGYGSAVRCPRCDSQPNLA